MNMKVSCTELEVKGVHPSPRYNFSMVYDEPGDRLVLFAGAHTGFLSDLWHLKLAPIHDGSKVSELEWRPIEIEGGPTKRSDQATLYDAIENRMIIHGGIAKKDLWALSLKENEEKWSRLKPLDFEPFKLSSHTAVYDSKSRKMILYGGQGAGPLLFSFIFGPDDVEYQKLSSKNPPARRGVHSAHYDRREQCMIIFGGYVGNLEYRNDIYRLNLKGDELNWEPFSLSRKSKGSPSSRAGHASVLDSKRKILLIHGGKDPNFVNDDFWLFNWKGNTGTWQELEVVGKSPPARHGHCFIYDQYNDCILCFGGESKGGAPLNDLWMIKLVED